MCRHRRFNPECKMVYADIPTLHQREMVLVIRIKCVECGHSFIFKGESGFSTLHPTTSIGGGALCAPILFPIDEDTKPAKPQSN